MSKYYYKDGSVLSYFSYCNSVLHRVDGPAVEKYEYRAWYFNGQLHRLDGPALIGSDDRNAWYIHGQWMTEAEFETHPERQKYLFEQELEKVLND